MRRAIPLLALAACKGGIPVLTLIDVEENALAVIVAVTEDEPVHAEGRCRSSDGDVRILARQGPDELLDLPLAGMAPDSRWTCSVDVDNGKKVKTYEIEASARAVPTGVGGYSVSGSTDGLTLVTEWDHLRAHPNVRTAIVDAEGVLRWYRFTDHEVVAGLDGTVTSSGMVLTGGGPDQPPTWYDSLGRARLSLGEPPIPGAYHHHVEPVDGGVVTLTNAQNTRGDGSQFTGFGVVHFGPTGAPLWTWDSQQAVDAGTLVAGAGIDPFHANSVTLLDDSLGPAAWVSLYRPETVIRIDRDTGEITHTLGAGGDFTLLDDMGDELPASAWFSAQHDPEFAWPRVLLYDNGLNSEQSRALELELDLDAATATVVWEWTDPGWFEPLFGDADRVSGDQVLLARGKCWGTTCGLPLDDSRLSSVVEVDRSGEITWELLAPDADRGLYRAERFDACLLWDDGDCSER